LVRHAVVSILNQGQIIPFQYLGGFAQSKRRSVKRKIGPNSTKRDGVSNRVKADVGGSKNSLLFVERRKKVERPVTWAPYVLKACCVENSLENIRIRMCMCWTYTQRRHDIPMRFWCMFNMYQRPLLQHEGLVDPSMFPGRPVSICTIPVILDEFPRSR
jgi:hypothetical protein